MTNNYKLYCDCKCVKYKGKPQIQIQYINKIISDKHKVNIKDFLDKSHLKQLYNYSFYVISDNKKYKMNISKKDSIRRKLSRKLTNCNVLIPTDRKSIKKLNRLKFKKCIILLQPSESSSDEYSSSDDNCESYCSYESCDIWNNIRKTCTDENCVIGNGSYDCPIY